MESFARHNESALVFVPENSRGSGLSYNFKYHYIFHKKFNSGIDFMEYHDYSIPYGTV